MKTLILTVLTILIMTSCGKTNTPTSKHKTPALINDTEYVIFENVNSEVELGNFLYLGSYLRDNLEEQASGKYKIKNPQSVNPGLYYYKKEDGKINFVVIPQLAITNEQQALSIPKGVSKWVQIPGIQHFKANEAYANRIRGNSFQVLASDEGDIDLSTDEESLVISVEREDALDITIGDRFLSEQSFSYLSESNRVVLMLNDEIIAEESISNPNYNVSPQEMEYLRLSYELGVLTRYDSDEDFTHAYLSSNGKAVFYYEVRLGNRVTTYKPCGSCGLTIMQLSNNISYAIGDEATLNLLTESIDTSPLIGPKRLIWSNVNKEKIQDNQSVLYNSNSFTGSYSGDFTF